ncbi:MAG: class I SAM-dependent methyltransferase [Deltaproteobacteria bacterium]|nr:class I SAM-dependent methyltransferase [Deltaproteobacteria bacterium]
MTEENGMSPAVRVGDFYQWIREDWIAISADAQGNSPGLLNFGFWQPGTSNLFEAQMAMYDRIIGWLDSLSPEWKGLEIGCGIGGTAVRLTAETGVGLTCLDLVGIQLDYARKRAREAGVTDKVDFKQGDAMAMDLPDNHYDFSYSMESTFHYPDVPAFLRENHRVLKPGARGVIADITCECPEAVMFREGNYFYGFDQMRNWLTAAGFELVAVDRIGDLVFGPLYRFMCSMASGSDPKLRRFWRLVLKNYSELAAQGQMGYDIFVVRKGPAVHAAATSIRAE